MRELIIEILNKYSSFDGVDDRTKIIWECEFGDIAKDIADIYSHKPLKKPNEIFIDPIIDGAAEFMGYTSEQVRSTSPYKPQTLVVSRMLITYVLLYMGLTGSIIGHIIGRNHATIIHYKNLFEYDGLFQSSLAGFIVYMAERGVEIPEYHAWHCLLRDRGQFKNSIGLK